MDRTCQYFVSVVTPCSNKASIELDGEFVCRSCAAIEKGRLEASQVAIERALGKVKARIKALKQVKSSTCQSAYRVAVKLDGMEDDV